VDRLAKQAANFSLEGPKPCYGLARKWFEQTPVLGWQGTPEVVVSNQMVQTNLHGLNNLCVLL